MSSSDSDEDCYGYYAKSLQSLNNKFHEDKLDSVNLLNDSVEINELLNSHNQNTNKVVALDNTLSDDEEIVKIIALNSKRTTRSSRLSKKITSPSNNDSSPTNTTGRSRGKVRSSKRLRNQTSNVSYSYDDSGSRSPRTLRKRGQSNRGRKARRSRQPVISYTTYSIGNCEEYEDLSNNVQLFSKTNNTTDVQVVEDDIFDENEELSVKVTWQSVDIVKFKIRKYQKITQIFEYFSNKINVSMEKLLFTYNDKILKPDDTPDTMNYNIAKFIDGGIVSNDVSQLTIKNMETKPSDGIQIKFQYPNSKKAFEIYVSKDGLLSVSMMKCAEHMEVPLKNLKFEFDGDSITGQMTPQELEMEGGECIDVKIIS